MQNQGGGVSVKVGGSSSGSSDKIPPHTHEISDTNQLKTELEKRLLKETFDALFRYDQTLDCLFVTKPIAVQGGVTMFADAGTLDLPSIYDGIPLGDGLEWRNGQIVVTVNGGLDEAALGDYLTTHKYATQTWVTSQLSSLHTHSNKSVLDTITSGKVAAWDSKESALGNPATNGYLLSSTTAGVRSWVKPYELTKDDVVRVLKDADGCIRLDAHMLLSGGLSMLSSLGVDVPSIFDNAPIATPTSKGMLDNSILGTGLSWVGGKLTATATAGTFDHTALSNRNAADQHTIAAITGLQDALDGKLSLSVASADYWHRGNSNNTSNAWSASQFHTGGATFGTGALAFNRDSNIGGIINKSYNAAQFTFVRESGNIRLEFFNTRDVYINRSILFRTDGWIEASGLKSLEHINASNISVGYTGNCQASMSGTEGGSGAYASWTNYQWYNTNWKVGVRRGGSVDYNSFSISKDDTPFITINDYNFVSRNRIGIGCNPTITLAIGDYDTGFDWESDGIMQGKANGVYTWGWSPSQLWTTFGKNLVIGSGGEAELRTRHVSGKHWLNDDDHELYLNWRTQKPVNIGGDITAGGNRSGNNGVAWLGNSWVNYGGGKYPMVRGSSVDGYIMMYNTHIAYAEAGRGDYIGSNWGSMVRFESPYAGEYFDIGVLTRMNHTAYSIASKAGFGMVIGVNGKTTLISNDSGAGMFRINSRANNGESSFGIQVNGVDKWTFGVSTGEANSNNFGFYRHAIAGAAAENVAMITEYGDILAKGALLPLMKNRRPGDNGCGGVWLFDNGIGYTHAAKFVTFQASTEWYGMTQDYGTGTGAQTSIVANCTNGNIGFYTGGNRALEKAYERMRIHTNGYISIGRTTASALLHVGGHILADGGITMLSDMRLKNRISNAKSVLPSISDIDVFRYKLKSDTTQRIYIGVSAQQIQGIWSEFVHGVETLSLDYAQMAAYVAIKGLQETKLWMDSKDKKIAELEKRIVELEKNVA